MAKTPFPAAERFTGRSKLPLRRHNPFPARWVTGNFPADLFSTVKTPVTDPQRPQRRSKPALRTRNRLNDRHQTRCDSVTALTTVKSRVAAP